MKPEHPTSDEDVQRYVDGELDESRYLEIGAQIERDESLARRVQAYREVNTLLAGYHLDVLSEPVPERLRPGRRRERPQRPLRFAAAIVLAIIGAAAGWQLHDYLSPAAPRELPRLVSQAISAYRVYTPEVLHPVEVGAADAEHLRKWLGRRLGTALKTPDLDAWGYRLLGGRLLTGDDESPHALIMYERADGARLSLYVARTHHGEADTALQFDRADDLAVFSWVDTPLSCAVVARLDSDLDRERLRSLSNDAYEQLER